MLFRGCFLFVLLLHIVRADDSWESHIRSRVHRFRRHDSPGDCDEDTSCLLGRRCVESRLDRHLVRDDDGTCQCVDEPDVCRIDAPTRGRYEDFECLRIQPGLALRRNHRGNCECESGRCSSKVVHHAWQQGLLTRYGWNMQCHAQSALGLHRSPIDGHSCVCESEMCELSHTSTSIDAEARADIQPPKCIALSTRPDLTRQTNSALCQCADDFCRLNDDSEPLACAQLSRGFVRDSSGKCQCAAGHCRRVGQHRFECVAETAALRRATDSRNQAVYEDHCICNPLTHCERAIDFESGRICMSLTEHPELQRRDSASASLSPASAAQCMCKPAVGICQDGYTHAKTPLQCLRTSETGFITNDQGHCDCLKSQCLPKDGTKKCVAGQRRLPWELQCA